MPRDLEAIVLKCLEKDKARRYATAGELAADLGRFLRSEPVTARLSSPWELTVKWMRRRPAIAALSAAVFLVGLIGIAGVFWQWRAADANAKKAKEQEDKATCAGASRTRPRHNGKGEEQEKKARSARDESDRQRDMARLQRLHRAHEPGPARMGGHSRRQRVWISWRVNGPGKAKPISAASNGSTSIGFAIPT